ncbi:uncharacterized protein [Channa argus]
MKTCDFVRGKLTEWDLCEVIQKFEDEDIDKETFLHLEESGSINILIPKIGPRVKFKKRLREYLQAQRIRQADIAEMDIDTNPVQEDSPEAEPTLFPWPPFSWECTPTSDIDSGSEMTEELIYPGATVTRGQGMLGVILFILRHCLTAAGTSDLMALLNYLIPNLAPALKYLSDKVPGLSIVFYCEHCQKYIGKNPDDGSCFHCQAEFNKASNMQSGHFFLSASLKDLLKDTLKNPSTKLLSKTVNYGPDIKDVMDGRMYQNLLRQGTLAADDLTLSLNCDGVPVFNSATYSIWPLQFTINELPYMQRKENVIVAGLWFGPEKPNMNTFLKPFVDECCDLACHPFQWRDSSGSLHSSKVFVLVCSSDAVARPLLRNCKQFNGEYGCDWCLHPGTMVRKGNGFMRCYQYDETKQIPRSNEMFRENAEQAQILSTPKNGVKGLSLLCMLPLFDIALGFVPEYMHSVLLGVSKQVMSLWMDPVNCMKPWYVGHKISEMDSCLLQLKPPSEITRPPRSLKCWEQWKAWEWQAFLLLYAIRVLPGIMNPVFLEHYFYLSFSIHILLQESLIQQDIELAHLYLVRFVKDMEVHYGKENVSFNCHQLIHLTESVQNWGPLWATSAFSFERNNGNLRSLLGNIKNNSQHIYQKLLDWQHIPRHFSSSVFNRHSDFNELLAKLSPVNDGSVPNRPFGKSWHLDLTESMKQVIEERLNRPLLVRSLEAFESFINGDVVYHSKKTDKTDCVVKLKSGCCGEIQMILLFRENCVCTSNCSCQAIPVIVFQLYNIQPGTMFCDVNLNSTFKRVERTDQHKAFFFSDIRCKCMSMDGCLVSLPNTYERY